MWGRRAWPAKTKLVPHLYSRLYLLRLSGCPWSMESMLIEHTFAFLHSFLTTYKLTQTKIQKNPQNLLGKYIPTSLFNVHEGQRDKGRQRGEICWDVGFCGKSTWTHTEVESRKASKSQFYQFPRKKIFTNTSIHASHSPGNHDKKRPFFYGPAYSNIFHKTACPTTDTDYKT